MIFQWSGVTSDAYTILNGFLLHARQKQGCSLRKALSPSWNGTLGLWDSTENPKLLLKFSSKISFIEKIFFLDIMSSATAEPEMENNLFWDEMQVTFVSSLVF
jgi:hypothetical protein